MGDGGGVLCDHSGDRGLGEASALVHMRCAVSVALLLVLPVLTQKGEPIKIPIQVDQQGKVRPARPSPLSAHQSPCQHRARARSPACEEHPLRDGRVV